MSTDLRVRQLFLKSESIAVASATAKAVSTIEDVAERLASLSPEKRKLFLMCLTKGVADTSMRIVPRANQTDSLPLSFAQQRLYFLNTYEPDNPSYNMPSALRLTGQLDCDALERSIGEVIRRHEVLRTTFSLRESKPVQCVAQPPQFCLQQTDLTQHQLDQRELLARQLATMEAKTPFDLHTGPLIRARLLRLAENDHVLLLTMHHIISDGESVGILMRELAILYGAFIANQPSPLPELPIQYGDFARWQRERLSGERMSNLLAYWKKNLDRLSPIIDLPTDRPRPEVRSHQGGTLPVEIPAPLVKSLKQLSRNEQVTLFITLLAAFKVLLYRLSAQDDIAVGSGITGRHQPETEDLIGFFINTLVLRTRLNGNPTFQELLKRVREVVLGAFAHHEIPLEKIVEELRPERDSSYSPLFQVMFSLQVMPPAAIEFAGVAVSAFQYEFGTSKFDMILSLFESTEGIGGYFEYNKDLFDETTIKRMLDHYLNILSEVVADPLQPINHIQIHHGESLEALPEAGVEDASEEFDFRF